MKKNFKKIIGIVLLISVFAYGLSFYLSFKAYQDNLMDSFTTRVTEITHSIETKIEAKQTIDNEHTLISIIHDQLWSNPDIFEINFIVPSEDETLTINASNKLENFDQVARNENKIAYDQDKLVTVIDKNSTPPTFMVISPIHLSGKTVGTYEIYTALKNVDASFSEYLETMPAIFLPIRLLMALPF